jgi:hypothetical protein
MEFEDHRAPLMPNSEYADGLRVRKRRHAVITPTRIAASVTCEPMRRAKRRLAAVEFGAHAHA